MRAIIVAIAAALVAVTVGAADATPGQCQRTIVRETQKYVQGTLARRQNCIEPRIFAGQSFDCSEDDPYLSYKLGGLKAKLRSHVTSACRNETLASVGWDLGVCPNLEGGACNDTLASFDDVVDCITCVNEKADSQVLALYYDALNHPEDPTPLRTCQRQIGDSGTDFFSKKIKALVRCDLRVLSGDLTGPCSSDPKTQQTIDALELRATSMLCSRCGGANHHCGVGDPDPGDIGFVSTCPDVTPPNGQPCGGPIASTSDLVACVACVTEFKVDCLSALVTPTLTPYPAECQ